MLSMLKPQKPLSFCSYAVYIGFETHASMTMFGQM